MQICIQRHHQQQRCLSAAPPDLLDILPYWFNISNPLSQSSRLAYRNIPSKLYDLKATRLEPRKTTKIPCGVFVEFFLYFKEPKKRKKKKKSSSSHIHPRPVNSFCRDSNTQTMRSPFPSKKKKTTTKTDGDVVPEFLVINFDGIALAGCGRKREREREVVFVPAVFATLCTHGRDQDVSCACLTAPP